MQAAQNILKQEYKDDICLADAVKLVVKVRSYVSLSAAQLAALLRSHGPQGLCLLFLFVQLGVGPAPDRLAAGCVQVLAKTLDSTQLTADKLEVSTITRDETHGGRVRMGPASLLQGTDACLHAAPEISCRNATAAALTTNLSLARV